MGEMIPSAILVYGEIKMKEESFRHIKCDNNDIGKYCILPGDPARCEKIAAYLDESVFVGTNREFTIYKGKLCGELVTVCSTGIGGPSAAIAIEELTAAGADTFVRVGTCGGISMKVKSGDCVIASASVRQEGTSREYAPVEYPAVADFTVTRELADASKLLGLPYHVGVVQSKDSFYGQHEADRMPISNELLNKWEAWKRLGVLASEMESAALFTVGASLGVRCGAVFYTLWNQERADKGIVDPKYDDQSAAIKTAVEAVKMMIKKNISSVKFNSDKT